MSIWEKKDYISVKKALVKVEKIRSQKKLCSIAENKSATQQVRMAAAKRIADQAFLVDFINTSGVVSSSAINTFTLVGYVTDQQALEHMVNKSANLCARMAAATRLAELGFMEESWLMEQINFLSKSDFLPNLAQIDEYTKKAFSMITTPTVLLQYQPEKRNGSMDSAFLNRVIELAKDDPEVFRQFRTKANGIVQSHHTDAMRQVPGVHHDHKQLVPGRSSDCHSDTIPWTPARTAFGHGYHQDGHGKGTTKHEDTNPFKTRFKAFLRDVNK